MKSKMFICALMLLAGITFYSCKPSDENLQKEIATALSTAQSVVSSTVKDGVVTLSGIVDSDEAKTAAETLAKGIKGIKSVVNNVEVKKPEPIVVINPDDTLKTVIGTALTAAGFKDVVAAIQNGEVTLTGTAKKADLQKIMQIANEAQPKKVINNITIK